VAAMRGRVDQPGARESVTPSKHGVIICTGSRKESDLKPLTGYVGRLS
jgi:hypothetical protein